MTPGPIFPKIPFSKLFNDLTPEFHLKKSETETWNSKRQIDHRVSLFPIDLSDSSQSSLFTKLWISAIIWRISAIRFIWDPRDKLTLKRRVQPSYEGRLENLPVVALHGSRSPSATTYSACLCMSGAGIFAELSVSQAFGNCNLISSKHLLWCSSSTWCHPLLNGTDIYYMDPFGIIMGEKAKRHQ